MNGSNIRRHLYQIVVLMVVAVLMSAGVWSGQALGAVPEAFAVPLDTYPQTAGFEEFGAARSNGYYHVGRDFGAGIGAKVYAVADGVVVYSGEFSGFGGVNPNRDGGAIVIRHRLANGQSFYALYGHIYCNARVVTNSEVSKGQVIGTIRPFYNHGVLMPHLHLGIFTGKLFPTSNWGTAKATTNWVDPLAFLSRTQTSGTSVTLPVNTVPQGKPARLSGQVHINDLTGETLPGAVITIDGQQTITGKDGEFDIHTVAGTHVLRITKNGYRPYENRSFSFDGHQGEVHFCLQQQLFSVSGTVYKQGAEPLPLAEATVILAGQIVKTGGDGVFHFQGVATGSYTLTVTCPGYQKIKIRGYRVSGNQKNIGLTLTRNE